VFHFGVISSVQNREVLQLKRCACSSACVLASRSDECYDVCVLGYWHTVAVEWSHCIYIMNTATSSYKCYHRTVLRRLLFAFAFVWHTERCRHKCS
jgi:hypothetical protein